MSLIDENILENANSLLLELGFDCINDNELALFERLCVSETYNDLSDTCKAIYLVVQTLKYRGLNCEGSTLNYLQTYSDCESCNINVEDIFSNKKTSSLDILGGNTCINMCGRYYGKHSN